MVTVGYSLVQMREVASRLEVTMSNDSEQPVQLAGEIMWILPLGATDHEGQSLIYGSMS